jgi:hypothetical protein
MGVSRRHLSRFGHAIIEAHYSALELRPDISRLGSTRLDYHPERFDVLFVMKQHRDLESSSLHQYRGVE